MLAAQANPVVWLVQKLAGLTLAVHKRLEEA